MGFKQNRWRGRDKAAGMPTSSKCCRDLASPAVVLIPVAFAAAAEEETVEGAGPERSCGLEM